MRPDTSELTTALSRPQHRRGTISSSASFNCEMFLIQDYLCQAQPEQVSWRRVIDIGVPVLRENTLILGLVVMKRTRAIMILYKRGYSGKKRKYAFQDE